MNIVCVYSVKSFSVNKYIYNPTDIYLGISYIATCLKQEGHTARLTVITPTTHIYRELSLLINEFKPSLFCLTGVSTQIPIIKQVGEAIRQINPSIFIILGGVHATLNPEEAIAYDFSDAVCIGEGENAVVELARQLEAGRSPSQIPNLWIKDRDTGQVEKNPVQPFIEDLDSLPFIDRAMWEPYIYTEKGMTHTVLVGRGCPNRCTYCSNHALVKAGKGRYVRFRSPDNIIAELRSLIDRYSQLESVFLEVETLGVNLKYTYQLLSALAEFNTTLQTPLKLGTNLALTSKIRDNRELLEALKRANFEYVFIGLESGSERIRKEVLNRPRYTNEEIIRFCQLAREYDINIRLNVLIGLPGETRTDFEETIKCVRSCQPTWGLATYIFFPYPGTKLFELCEEQKLLKPEARTTIHERTSSVLNLPGFSPWQIRKELMLFYYKVYRGHKPWIDIMMHTLYDTIHAFPIVKRLISSVITRFEWIRHAIRSVFVKSFRQKPKIS